MGWFITVLVAVSFGLGLLIGHRWTQSENRHRERDKELEDFFNGL